MDLVRRIGRDKLKALAECLDVDPEAVDAVPLSGGLYSRSVLIQAPGGEWVVRFPDDVVASRLDATIEARLLATVAEAGLSPPPVAGAPGGFVITRFLKGARTLAEADVRNGANIERIAGSLRALHGVAFDLPGFHAEPVARSYVDRLDVSTLSSEQCEWRSECLALAGVIDSYVGVATLCHNDLVASNFLDDGNLWLIDFEYAVCADPMLDLASLAAMNGFSDSECELLIANYFARKPVPFDRVTFSSAVRFQCLIAYFWALGNGVAGDENTASAAFVERMVAMLR